MRVLTVARWYPSHDSPGRGSFVADLVRATVAAGVDARVVSFDRVLVRGRQDERDAVLAAARAAYDRVVAPGALFVPHAVSGGPEVPVARIPVIRRPGTGDAAALIEDHLAALRPFVTQLAETWRPDVIHAHTGLPDGIAATEIGRELGIPVVVSEHMSTIEAELADPVALDRYRGLLGPGVRLLGVSPSLAGRVAAILGVPTERLGILPNPVEDGSFTLADASARDADELLWVGSIGEQKGIDVLLRAFVIARDRRPNLRLRLVGGERATGDRSRLEDLGASLGVGAFVSFDGWLTRVEVAAAMAHAGAFVHPSRSETFGVAAAEAILTGLPIAARRSGGVPWIIELSGGFGRVAKTDDPEAFALAIEETLDGGLDVGREEARWRLIATVGASAVADQALALYESAVATPRPPAPSEPRAPVEVPRASTKATATRALPRVIVATERLQATGLVAALPAALQGGLVLVVPAATGPEAGPLDGLVGGVRIAEADPFRAGPPRPRGRTPLARLRRALWKPAPTADELLGRAVLSEATSTRRRGVPLDVIAIDAPAAVLVARLDARRVRLAPGSLRWLADSWAAERDRMPPST